MGSSNIRDLLTAFSPSMDSFAMSTGDGRVKIWDTVKGQVQSEFTDMVGSEESESLLSPNLERESRGHLSVDYTCMKWLSLLKQKKRKLGCSVLILGTGGGDVLALDVAAGHLRWRLRDCHPGGVSSVSFAKNAPSSVYTAGSDGMVCRIDSSTGNLLGKFKASSKAISSMAVSPDGKVIVTAAGQLRTFNASDHKKLQKFSGHPGSVRCLIFSEDGEYILSSATAERYVAVWSVGGTKKQSASCVLAMDHPAVFLDVKHIHTEGDNTSSGIYVLSVSETGVCYFWFGKDIEELRNAKPTKISVSSEDISSKSYNKGVSALVFAAILQSCAKASGQVFVAHGLVAKPSFRKIVVECGTDVVLSSSRDGILLPATQSVSKSKKGLDTKSGVIALDRANAEDALLPMPKVLDPHEKKNERVAMDGFAESKDVIAAMEIDTEAVCLEDRLRSLGLLTSMSKQHPSILGGINLEAVTPPKKMKEAVLSKPPSEAYKLLGVLLAMWQSGSCNGKYIVPWIYSVLVNHSRCVVSEEPATQTLNSLVKVCKSRGSAIQPLLQLSGRLQLVTAKIDKAGQTKTPLAEESDDDEDDVEDVRYEEDDENGGESEISSDDNSDDRFIRKRSEINTEAK